MIPDLPVYGFEPDLGGLLGLAIAVVLPLLAGLLTRQTWPSSAKGVVLLTLAAVKTILEAWLEATNKGVDFAAIPVVYSTMINFGVAVVAYFGLWRGSPIATTAQRSLVRPARVSTATPDT